MDGMDMGGMDMSTSGVFAPTNMAIARGYWYAIAAAVGLLTCIRIAKGLESRRRLRSLQREPYQIASRPHGMLSQAIATATAVFRELSYPQPITFAGRFSKHFTPMPTGQWIFLSLYWIVILIFLWSNTILALENAMYPYRWEIVGFRAAWVSVAQIPLIYLLSCKFNPISMLTGISHERFNWLHRWTARTVFLTVIVHWSFFVREWSLANFVGYEMQMMPMVKYGFGAWAVIGWMILCGFGFVRAKAYELFVAQHIAAAATLLWLLYVHVPSYARYNIYMAIAFVAFDWGMRIGWNVLRNMHVLSRVAIRTPGYSILLEPLPGDMVRLTIEDADFTWKAGQYMYISIPSVRPLELHPFTIASPSATLPSDKPHRLIMVIKAQRGFSRSLHNAAVKSASTGRRHRAFLSGPWGSPPDLLHFETVILIATSTGASFTTPLAEQLIRQPGCVRKVILHWIIRSSQDHTWFGETLNNLVDIARERGFSLQVIIHITQSIAPPGLFGETSSSIESRQDEKPGQIAESGLIVEVEGSSLSSRSITEEEKTPLTPNRTALPPASVVAKHSGRPSVESIVRPSVEAALGETAVVVCGGSSITAQVRTFVAKLSDERAVHKGSGAQGVFLFVETFGW